MNPFSILGLSPSLLLEDEAIKSAYDQSAKGEPELQARNNLLSPVTRIEAWMVAHHIEKEKHTQLPEVILPLFTQMADTITTIRDLAQKKSEASTFLTQTLLDKKLFEQKDHLDVLSQKVESLKSQIISQFPLIEETADSELSNSALQILKFQSKWEAELNQGYTMLLG